MELQDEYVQSVWLKGGYKNCRDIYFCHSYREHLSKESSAVQQNYLSTFLDQWEAAVCHNNAVEPNETHICGDINIDVLENRWLKADYPLIQLSRLIKNVCHSNNFDQLVQGVTRSQYDSVNRRTVVSCIDHVYTNAKFRCSSPRIISFGDSDHDLIKYVRYSKLEQGPVRLVSKRSYKKFDCDSFLKDISETDWTDVYLCQDVDSATEVFTQKFKFILNTHAPWTKIRQRKFFAPWLTDETKKMMKDRDHWKSVAKTLAINSSITCHDQINAWAQYRRLRNKVNNRKKKEELLFKTEKLSDVANDSKLLWKSAKKFIYISLYSNTAFAYRFNDKRCKCI